MKETEQTPEENTVNSFTESAYTTVSSNTHTCGKFEIKSHYDFEPESAYKEGEEIDPVYEVGKNKDDGNKQPVSASSESQEAKIILEKFRQFITDQKDIDPEIAKVIQAKLWEII